MNKTLRLIGGLTAVGVFLVACKSDTKISGTLAVTDAFSITASGKSGSIAAGNYPTIMDVDSKGQTMTFTVTTKTGDLVAALKIPAGSSLGLDSGKVVIKGTDNGQSFDLEAESSSDSQVSGSQSGYESCNYTTSEYGCWTEPDNNCGRRLEPVSLDTVAAIGLPPRPPGPPHPPEPPHPPVPPPHPPGPPHPPVPPPHPPGPPPPHCVPTYHQVCGYRPVERVGSRFVVFHYITEENGTSARVTDPQSGKILAVFTAESLGNTEKIYEQTGICR